MICYLVKANEALQSFLKTQQEDTTMRVFHTECKEWQGFKPCAKQKQGLSTNCCKCGLYEPFQENILIIEAGGLGSALRTSIVTKELRTLYPKSLIQWVTNEKVVELLLKNTTSVDRVYSTTWENLVLLAAQSYSLVINFESKPLYLAISKELRATKKSGFISNNFGNLELSSLSSSEFLYLQTSDRFRMRKNKKPMQQILLEVAGLEWREQSYDLVMKEEDNQWAQMFLKSQEALGRKILIGLNIGSSLRHSAKRWPAKYFYKLAKLCQKKFPKWKFLVLAGPEDINAYEIVANLNRDEPLDNLVFTGYQNTISQFISLVNFVSLLISADTFGLHVALGLGKKAISLWGPQSKTETYHYRKEKKITLGLNCSPCFLGQPEECSNPISLQCMNEISVHTIFDLLKRELLR